MPQPSTGGPGVRQPSSGPDITIVIPVYNKREYLETCLDSVLNQSGVAFEVICIDDCATDGSGSTLESYAAKDSRIRLIKNVLNSGAAHSRNIGINLARGRYVQFTDADDVLPSGSLEALYQASERTGADVIRGTLQHILGPSETKKEERVGILLDLPELWIPWFHYRFLIRRKLLIQQGIQYPHLIAGEDPVFMARVLTAARSICIIPTVTYMYRQNDHRPQPTLRTIQDYLHHAEMVKMIFAGKYSCCWDTYCPFIKDDIRLLVSQANVSQDAHRFTESELHNL